MKIIVILTTYNRPVLFKNTINSLFNQKYDNLNNEVYIYVMDNMSNNDVVSEIKNIISENKTNMNVSFHQSGLIGFNRNEICGFTYNINKAIEIIKKEHDLENSIIMYSCDDAFYYEDKLQSHIDAYNNNDVDVVYNNFEVSTITVENGSIKSCDRNCFNAMLVRDGVYGRDFDAEILKRGSNYNYIDHQSLSHKAEILNRMEYPYWDESLDSYDHGDWTFWNKLLSYTQNFYYLNKTLDTKFIHDYNVQQVKINGMLEAMDSELMEGE